MSLIERSKNMYLTFLGHARKHQEEADVIRANNPPIIGGWPERQRLIDAQIEHHLQSVERWNRKAAELKADGTGNLLLDPSSEDPDELLMHFEHGHECFIADVIHAKRVVYAEPFASAAHPGTVIGHGVS